LADGGFIPVWKSGQPKPQVTVIIERILRNHVGASWDKSLQDTLQREFFTQANLSLPANIVGLSDPFAAVGTLIAAALDPGNWVRILAIIAGFLLVGFGGVTLIRSAAQ
jgi:hypothetical protein